jgi:hypothetical protein
MIACVVCIVTSVVIVLTWRLIKTIRAGSANPDDIEFENPVRNGHVCPTRSPNNRQGSIIHFTCGDGSGKQRLFVVR